MSDHIGSLLHYKDGLCGACFSRPDTAEERRGASALVASPKDGDEVVIFYVRDDGRFGWIETRRLVYFENATMKQVAPNAFSDDRGAPFEKQWAAFELRDGRWALQGRHSHGSAVLALGGRSVFTSWEKAREEALRRATERRSRAAESMEEAWKDFDAANALKQPVLPSRIPMPRRSG